MSVTRDDRIERAERQIERDFEQHLERTRALLRQPSISADGTGIIETAQMLAAWIRELGGTAELVETPMHPVVIGEIDAGQPHTLLFYGMYDVQPVLGETWLVPPFGGEIVDLPGYGPSLVNRGVANQKGPLGSFLNTVQAIQQANGRLPVNVKFLIEGEEELGSRNLPQVVSARREQLRADAAFFAFFSQNQAGKIIAYLGVKGILFFELVARGGDWGAPTTRAVHGSNAVWFHNPAWLLVHALASMVTPDQKHILIDGFYDDLTPPSAADEALLARLSASFNPEDELDKNDVRRFKYDLSGVDLLRKYLYQPTLNIDGIISGHTAEGTKTIIPHEARAKIDIRMPPHLDPQRMIALVRAHLDRHGFADVELEVEDAYTWSKSSIDDAPVRALMRTYRELGHEPEIWPHLAGSAPFYLFTDVLGIPVALGGLGHGGRQHSPNEYATVQGIKDHELSLARFLYRLADELSKREG
ncbi:MAG TPA: M20/M25/M40 family metallo-hydrolase [Thermomicrobiaceae bacterium]|nr:M20/M25/M40 family metallo-hydrolase [Thermomicrobiaceae bacterium]